MTDSSPPEAAPSDRFWLGAVYALIVLGFVAGGWIVSNTFIVLPPCAFRQLTGLPCMTCGSTRCFTAISEGHFLEAFLFNPLVFAASVFLIVWGTGRAVSGMTGWQMPELRLTPDRRRGLVPIVLALVVANWIYLIFTLPE